MLGLPINAEGWALFSTLIRHFRASRYGTRALLFFIALMLLLVATNVLNIVNSYVGRDFMSALADHHQQRFIEESIRYLMVFGALTITAVIYRFCEESLGLLWREYMTTEYLHLYMKHPTYYRMNDELIRKSGVEHPDQRIAEDVKTFAITTLSFILMITNGIFTVVAFSGVLWMISPWLFGAALGYAILGSFTTVKLGGKLVNLNYAQLDKEAAFRSELIHVREHAESVALLHDEAIIRPRLLDYFKDLAGNYKKIIAVNRNLAFFTTGYFHLIQVIPIFLVAPLLMEGRVEFGVVTQSAMAFGMLVGAFSLIVTQFQNLSNFSAVIQRLITLWYVIELAQTTTVTGFDVIEDDDHIGYEHLTLISESDKRMLVKDLSLSIPHGLTVLVSSHDDAAKDALFKATAGIYDAGSGVVHRPVLDDILFLPERPYLPPGPLRRVLSFRHSGKGPSDDEILSIFKTLNIAEALDRAGGMDKVHEWDTFLTAHEQRFISLARIILAKPKFAVINHLLKDLPAEELRPILELFKARDITVMMFGLEGSQTQDDHGQDYGAVLELLEGGAWRWTPIKS